MSYLISDKIIERALEAFKRDIEKWCLQDIKEHISTDIISAELLVEDRAFKRKGKIVQLLLRKKGK